MFCENCGCRVEKDQSVCSNCFKPIIKGSGDISEKYKVPPKTGQMYSEKSKVPKVSTSHHYRDPKTLLSNRPAEITAVNKSNIRTVLTASGIISMAVLLFVFISAVIVPSVKVGNITSLLQDGDFYTATQEFDKNADNTKVSDRAVTAMYIVAEDLFSKNDYANAALLFQRTYPYGNSMNYLRRIAGYYRCRLTSSRYHTVAVKYDGTVLAIGNNYYGQCDVFNWNDIVAVYADDVCTLAVTGAGKILVAGYLEETVKNTITLWENIIQVAANNYRIVGLKSDGTVVAVQRENFENWLVCDVSGMNDIVSISLGENFIAGLRSDGTISIASNYENIYGSSGYMPNELGKLRDVIGIYSGYGYTIGLHRNGDINIVTENGGAPFLTERHWDIIDVVNIYNNSDYQAVALRADGTVSVISGQKDRQQLAIENWRNLIAISVNPNYTIGLTTAGDLLVTGTSDYGQYDTSGFSNAVDIALDGSHLAVLHKDGKVTVLGENEKGQCDTADWSDIIKVSVGETHTVGLKSDGTVVSVGDFKWGNGNFNANPPWDNITDISAHTYQTIGLKKDGAILVLGGNGYNQGYVDNWTNIKLFTSNYLSLVGMSNAGDFYVANNEAFFNRKWDNFDFSEWNNIVKISNMPGIINLLGIRSDGTVVHFGDDQYGQNNIAQWNNISDVTTSSVHSVGLKTDGTVLAIGDNFFGQCDVSDWRSIVAIGSDDSHTVGVTADGKIIVAGSFDFGQTDFSAWVIDEILNVREVNNANHIE